MKITMTNKNTKLYLVKKTGLRIFGDDFDYRRKEMADSEAEQRFDAAWTETIAGLASSGELLELDVVRKHVKGDSASWINEKAPHKHFRIENKFFIAQFPSPNVCDQMWPISSAIKDPWTIYTRFAETAIVDRIEVEASKLGWKAEELAEKLLLDFLETVTHEKVPRLHPQDEKG
jgi:hypothetical protein